MDVLFRKDKNTKEIVAFLPECPVNYGNILCYMHIGQHSEATLQYYWDTVKATEEEYKPFLEELEKLDFDAFEEIHNENKEHWKMCTLAIEKLYE